MIQKNLLQCNFSIFSVSVMLPVCFEHGWGILLYFKHRAGMKTSSCQRQSPITDSQTVQAQTCTDIISIVKPTRCTIVSNLIYFGMTFYVFRTVFPAIIRSSRLYIQQHAYVKQILPTACKQADCSICLTYACCCMYSLELLMMDGKTMWNT